jgi:hypothetical protein
VNQSFAEGGCAVKSGGQRWLVALVVVAGLSFVAKLVIAGNTYGSLDAMLWENNLRELRQDGPVALYQHGTDVRIAGLPEHHEVYNHPPFMIRVLAWLGWLADITGLPLRFWMRAECAFADVVSIILLMGLMLRRAGLIRSATLVLTAASPVSLMISGFHCNVDPIMTAWVVLSVYLAETGPAWIAGAAFGMALNFKIVPLIFAPAFFFFLNGWKRITFFGACAGIFVLGSLPILAQDPVLICKSMFSYNPISGRWGISRFVFVVASETVYEAYSRTSKFLALGILALTAYVVNRRRTRPPLALQFGLMAYLFVALIPGFGVQYLAWLAPWTCFLKLRQALAFHVTGGALLFCNYTRAANGFPWNFAYNGASEWYGSVVFIGLVCWLAICWLAFCFARQISGSTPNELSGIDAGPIQIPRE